MNEQDKEAFKEWFFDNFLPLDKQAAAMSGWQACCEYKDKQAAQAEPVALSDEWTPCMKLPVVVHVRKQREGEQHVSTREGITPVKPDDLIMRGVSGEEYPIGRDIFEQTYSTKLNHPAPAVAQVPADVVRELVGALREFLEAVEEPPEPNCCCHISPPCADCVENAYLRDAFKKGKSAIKSAKENGL